MDLRFANGTTRRSRIPQARAVCGAWNLAPLLVATLLHGGALGAAAADAWRVYLGGYTRHGAESTGSEGIYRAEFDAATGVLGEASLAAKIVDPSFIAIHPRATFLYAVDREAETDGGLSAFAIEPASGALTPLGQRASCGGGPCYVAVDPTGECALVANYHQGLVAALPIRADGGLGDATSSFVDAYLSPTGCITGHAHWINVDPANRFAVATDLGFDELRVYSLDARSAKLSSREPHIVKVKSGSGPRHVAFHPGGKFVYSNMETSNQVVAFGWDGEAGSLSFVDAFSTLPPSFQGQDYTAEIQIHPNGRFLYVSNRGHDSIAIFAIDVDSGRLTSQGWQPTGGKTPRNFAIDPTGRWLLAANIESNNVVVFQIDPDSGRLEPTGRSIRAPAPSCVKFAPRPAAESRPTE